MQQFTEKDFDTVVAQGITLVDFYAEWCGPCKILGQLMPHLANKYTGKVLVGKVNTETEFMLSQRYSITGLPTVIILKDGQEVERLKGLHPPEKYSEVLDKRLAV